MDGCVFCRIAKGEVPAKILFADDELVVFHDIAPRAPVHALVIPRRHIASLADLGEGDGALLGRLLLACNEAARRTGIVAGGYRVVSNSGADAGQTVGHLHFHVFGGRLMGWPPG
jgi:histidine triad (HIT) family protein